MLYLWYSEQPLQNSRSERRFAARLYLSFLIRFLGGEFPLCLSLDMPIQEDKGCTYTRTDEIDSNRRRDDCGPTCGSPIEEARAKD